MNFAFLRSGIFWLTAIVTFFAIAIFLAWELNLLSPFGFAGLPRPIPTIFEKVVTLLIAVLFALNMALFSWRRRYGTCSRSTGAATGAAGIMGAIALICPVCVLAPIAFAGISFSLVSLAPFAPLLQIIALFLLTASLLLLLPKKN